MKAWVLKNFGYENLSFEDYDQGTLSDGEVLVKVHSIGVCYRDTIDMTGAFPFMKFPTIPGHEMCGEVIEASHSSPYQKGDIVISMHGGSCGKCFYCLTNKEYYCSEKKYFMWTIPGVYAEYVKAPWNAFIKVPSEILQKYTPDELSFLYCTAGTAYRAIAKKGKLKGGEFIVITGAGGGVGIHAVQIASAMGARVIAVSSSPDKKKIIEQYGAHWVIDFDNGRFNKEVMRITGGIGADICIENTGSVGLEGALRSLRKNGILILIGNLRVDKYQLNPGYLILNEINVLGSIGADTEDMFYLFGLMASGKLKPVLHKTLPLKDMLDAHKYLRERKPLGRIVLHP